MKRQRPTISIVVPVYNVAEHYLRHCIDSVCNQTFPDFELILVDDGSLDNCGKICDEYAKNDNRIRVIHQENQGVSVARNTGIDIATGKWLMFVDADDWIEPDTCKEVISTAERLGVQLLRFAMFTEWVGKSVESRILLPNEVILSTDKKYDFTRAVIGIQGGLPLTAPYCALFLLKDLKSSGIRFPEGVHLSQDHIFQIQASIHFDRIAYLDVCLYHYIRRKSSATGGKYRADYEFQKENYVSQIEHIVYNNMVVSDELSQTISRLRFGIMQGIVLKHYFHQDSPLSYSERLKACNLLVEKSKNKEALESINCKQLSIKQRIVLYLFKRRAFTLFLLLHRMWMVIRHNRNIYHE